MSLWACGDGPETGVRRWWNASMLLRLGGNAGNLVARLMQRPELASAGRHGRARDGLTGFARVVRLCGC